MEGNGWKKWIWWKSENEDENDGEGEVDSKDFDREKTRLHRKRLVYIGLSRNSMVGSGRVIIVLPE